MSAILFDIGGTQMRMALAKNGAVTHVQKIATPDMPEEALQALMEYKKNFAGDATSVYGGVAGVIDNTTIHFSPHLPGWKEFPLAPILEERLMLPVHIQNDAELAALGEAIYGAGKDHALVAYVGIGTGIGAAYVQHGTVVPHADGFEPGHQILDVEKGATLEDLVSGSAIRRTFGKGAEELSPHILDELTPTLAVGLHNILLAWSPDILVLGGSLINEKTGYRLSRIQDALAALPQVFPMPSKVVRAALGDENGLYGALARATTLA